MDKKMWRKYVAWLLVTALLASACGAGSTGTEAAESDTDRATEIAPEPTIEVAEPEPTAPEPAATVAPTAVPPTPTPIPPTPTPDPDRDGDGVDNEADDFPDDATRSVALEAIFPVEDGAFSLPEDLPSVQALHAVIEALETGETSLVTDRLGAGFGAADVVGVLDQVQADGTDRWDVIDVRAVTPWWLWVMLADASSPTSRPYLTRVGLDPNTEEINELALNAFARGLGALQYQADRARSIDDVMETIDGRTGAVAALVAEVTDDGCRSLGGLNEAIPLNTASVYKTWVLGAAAGLVNDGSLSVDEAISFVPGDFMSGGALTTGQFESTFELTAQTTANLMMGQSDNGATDLMERRVGRDDMAAFVERSGVADPTILNPIIGIRDYDHFFASVPQSQVDAFVNGTEDEQRRILDEVIEPLGPSRQGSFGNPNVLDYTWKASPLDVCEAMATMRRENPTGSAGAAFIDEAFGAESFLFGLRTEWDRVWYKGGGIPSFQPNSNIVYTHASMVESDEHGAYAVIMMFNDEVGFSMAQLPFDAQSWLARLHEIVLNQR